MTRLDSAVVSLVVDRYELGPIGTNCYIVRGSRAAPEAVVIDPGASAAELRLELAQMRARCTAILITHSHWDHLGGVADLEQPQEFYADAPVAVRPYSADVELAGGEAIDAAGIQFEVLRVPGHSPAHLAYYADGCLFSGDVLFAGSVGRTDLPGGGWDTLVESIRLLMERYPPETAVYSGHGPPTTLGAELSRNPFLAELRA